MLAGEQRNASGMAQKRRKTSETGLDRITLMIPAELKRRLESEVEPGVRTFSDVVRDCLKRGMDAEYQGYELTPWARAVGRATGLLADFLCAADCPRDAALGIVRTGADVFFSSLGAEKPNKDDQKSIELFARTFARAIAQTKEPPNVPHFFVGGFGVRGQKDELLKIASELVEKERV